MATNNFFKSDLYNINHIVQNSATLYSKELVIATLRDAFSRDTYYHYAHDHWGYPQTPDHTDLPLDAGYKNDITTRLFIGESYRFDTVYFPAIVIKHGGVTSTPISINREAGSVQWGKTVFQDGYGNIATFPSPTHFIFALAWTGTINIEVMARDLRARDDLVDIILALFTDVAFEDLKKSGLIIDPNGVSSGTPSETDDRNDHLFRQTISLRTRSEYRRNLPISNIIEVINMGIEFGRVNPDGIIAPNLTIQTSETLMEMLAKL